MTLDKAAVFEVLEIRRAAKIRADSSQKGTCNTVIVS